MDINSLIVRNLGEINSYLEKNKISAFRLISNTPGILPLTVDIYQDNAVVHVLDYIAPDLISDLQQALKNILHVQDFFFKNNSKKEFTLPESRPKKIILEEYGQKFIVNLSDYLDTGIFLDHRETRKWMSGQCRDKIMLNTFAYTGSFTIYAANSGARKTYSVDISRVYCEWTKENLALNSLTPEQNWVYKMDTLEFFQYAKRKKLEFDIIVIDPPTFSKNKGKSFSVQKDHPALINSALELLTPTGWILFSSNYREFRMDRKNIQPCTIKEKTDTIPPDYRGTIPHRCFIISKQDSKTSSP